MITATHKRCERVRRRGYGVVVASTLPSTIIYDEYIENTYYDEIYSKGVKIRPGETG